MSVIGAKFHLISNRPGESAPAIFVLASLIHLASFLSVMVGMLGGLILSSL